MIYKTGVVIVNYNKSELIREIVGIFSNYTSISNIAVVDNNSTDNAKSILHSLESDKVKIIYSETNGGYAKGNNIGLKYLWKEKECNICFVVNPDVYFGEVVITTVVDYMIKNPQYAIMTCAQIDPLKNGPSCQYGKMIFDTFWLQFLYYFNLPRHYYILPKYYAYSYDKNYKGIIDIKEALGSFYGIRMNCFDYGVVLDEGTFLYWEEQILSYRVRARGYKIGYVSCCTYEHRHIQYSATANTKSLTLLKYSLQSQRHFQNEYLHFNKVQRLLVRIAEMISLVERWFIMRIK